MTLIIKIYSDTRNNTVRPNLSDITPEELPGRSGSIQAALNLELGTDAVNRINVKLEGLNGQLPNLDLVNTVNRLCKKERIASTIQKRVSKSVSLSLH